MEDGAVEFPISDVLDLHSFAPRDCEAVVEEYLREAYARGYRGVRIIHGRGIGVQREMVRRVLFRTVYVRAFADAPAEAGGWGATVVTFGEGEQEEKMDQAEQIMAEFDATLAEARRLVEGMSGAEFNWRKEAGQWSVGQCLDHLAVTGGGYADKLEAVLVGAPKGSGPFGLGWLERMFVRSIEPPVKQRFRAPGAFRPVEDAAVLEVGETWKKYEAANRRLRAVVGKAKGVDWKKVKVVSPASRWLKFSFLAAVMGMTAHERRHLEQAKGVVAARVGLKKV